MDFSAINWLAVVACVVASMVIGGVWFGPKTFFPAWWKAVGKEGEPTMGNAMGSMSGGATLGSGALAGFLLWLGFVAPSSLTNKLFPDRIKA